MRTLRPVLPVLRVLLALALALPSVSSSFETRFVGWPEKVPLQLTAHSRELHMVDVSRNLTAANQTDREDQGLGDQKARQGRAAEAGGSGGVTRPAYSSRLKAQRSQPGTQSDRTAIKATQGGKRWF